MIIYLLICSVLVVVSHLTILYVLGLDKYQQKMVLNTNLLLGVIIAIVVFLIVKYFGWLI